MERFLTVGQAAKALRLSPAKVYQMLEAGEIVHCRFGRARRIPANELEKFIESHTVGCI